MDQFISPNTSLADIMPPKKKGINWLLIGLITAIVLILGAGGYLAYGKYFGEKVADKAVITGSDTSTDAAIDTSNWKTYQDSTYSFNFRYPNDWYVKAIAPTNGDNSLITINASSVDLTNSTGSPEFSIQIYSNLAKLNDASQNASLTTLKDFLEKSKYADNQLMYKDVSESSIGGKDCYVATSTNTAIQNGEIYFVKLLDDKIVQISDNALSKTTKAIDDSFSFTDPTAGWKTYNLSLTKSTIKYPSTLPITTIADSVHPEQARSNYLNKTRLNGYDSSDGYVYEFNISEWLKGPDPEDGYVLDKNKRAGLLSAITQVYSDQRLTDSTKQQFNNYSLEFMTYSATDRIYVGYLESNDGKSRGLAMINTHGQDIGLSAEYQVSLYNQEKNSLVSVYYQLSGKEIDTLRGKYGDYVSANVEIDKQVHTEFSNLMANTKRSDLSFGSQMDTIDLMVKSWTY